LALQVNKEVGVTLNAMSLYADHSLNQLTLHKNGHLLPYLNRMLQDSKNMVESMSDIVWLLSTSNDSLEQVFFRLQYRGKKMLQDTGGSFRLIYPDEMPLKEMNMEIRRFIYTDFKSIMNSFHTLPDLQVEVAATTQENQLQLIWRINYSGPACSLSDLINDSAYNCTVDCMQAGAGDRFCFSSSWEWNSIQELMHQ
jgi:hypothetical protein